MNEMRIGHQFALHGMGKAPFAARDGLPEALGRIAHGKNVLGAGGIVDRIAFPSARSKHDVSQWHVVYFLRWREIRTHQPANFLASRIMSDRGGKPHFLSFLREIKLPAQPRDRVSFAQQETVPEFAVGVRRISAVHQPQDSSSAAVRNFKQHGAVSLVPILRFIEIEVRGKLHFSLRVARSLIQIHDLPVVSVFRTDRKVHPPDDPLVSARQSERPAALNVFARNNLHARNMRVSR